MEGKGKTIETMLDDDDEQVIKEAKDGGCVLVTWDKVLREAANGITPYELMDRAKAEGQGTPQGQAEISRLRTLTPQDLSVLGESANKTATVFRQKIDVDEVAAKMIRLLRVKKGYSWRAVARHCSEYLNLSFGGNQIAGMVICEKAAKILGEDYMAPPWN